MKMKTVYFDMTSFFENREITYSDRVLLQYIIWTVKKNNNICLFYEDGGKETLVDRQIIAEYLFSKNVDNKKKYIQNNLLDYQLVTSEDEYFELISEMNSNLDTIESFEKFEKKDCIMTAFFPFEFYDTDNYTKKRIAWQCKNFDRILCGNEEIEKGLRKNAFLNSEVEIFPLEELCDIHFSDRFLAEEKGFQRLSDDNEYIVILIDNFHTKKNRNRIKMAESNYPNTKIVLVGYFDESVERSLKNIYSRADFGKNIFTTQDVSYYQTLKLYRNAKIVIIPEEGRECAWEEANLKKMNVPMTRR